MVLVNVVVLRVGVVVVILVVVVVAQSMANAFNMYHAGQADASMLHRLTVVAAVVAAVAWQ